MTSRRPNFFIVGAPKCGTTALHDFLGQHPDVFTLPFKEIHYFGSDLVWPNRPSLEEYLALFAGWGGQRVAGECSVYYLSSRVAATEINAFNPAAKAIIMLRNPIDVIHALFHQVRSNLQEDIEDLETALDAEELRRMGQRLPQAATKPQQLMYRDTVSFSAQVERFFTTMGRERVMVLLHDDFERRPVEIYRQTVRFLGVDDRFEPAMRRINASHTYRSEWLQRLVAHPPGWLAASARRALSESLLRRLAARARTANTRPTSREPMPALLRHRLAIELRPDVERLSRLLDRDLTLWLRDA